MPVNEFGQPVGEDVAWRPRPPLPSPGSLAGRTCRLEPLGQEHLADLWQALCVESPPETWTYMYAGPFADPPALAAYAEMLGRTPGMLPFAVLDDPRAGGRAAGIACLMRDDPAHGVVEVGTITYGSRLQRTVAATEAMHLLAAYVLEDQRYRRYEWKCDALNAPSRRAAERLGFTFEGVFRNAVVYKGRNRDTAWFSITDDEWPRVRDALRAWLDEANFDAGGRQRRPLEVPR